MSEVAGSTHHTRGKMRTRQLAPVRAIAILLCAILIVFCLYRAAGSISLATNRLAPNFGANAAAREQNNAHVQNNAHETAWYLILVNEWNFIPADYEVEFTELANGQSVDKRIYPALQEMFDTARSHGVYPLVASGYRSEKKQQRLLEEKIAEFKTMGFSTEEATARAAVWVAVPGTSEHQLGIAVDINADGVHSSGDEVYRWLEQNAYQFGFIRRYPPEKTEITGVANEPWHYRYVGIEAATEIQKQGICLEEYLLGSHI